jgi:hypothetical protein
MKAFTLSSIAAHGQEHEERTYAVNAERVGDPERRYPRVYLGELHLVGRGVEAGQHRDRKSEIEQGETERRPSYRVVTAHQH